MIRSIKDQANLMRKISNDCSKATYSIAHELEPESFDLIKMQQISNEAFNLMMRLLGDGHNRAMLFLNKGNDIVYADYSLERFNDLVGHMPKNFTENKAVVKRAWRVDRQQFIALENSFKHLWDEMDQIKKGEE